jgi:hypothetical protein
VPWGTTNDDQILNDPTGTRRYWIIRIAQEADYKGIPTQRDRIWRTVLLWMDQGMTTWLNRKDDAQRKTLEAAAARGAAATFDDPWVGVLLAHTEEVLKAHRKQQQRKPGTPANGYMLFPKPAYVTRKEDDGSTTELLFLSNHELLNVLDIDKGRRSKGDAMRASAAMRQSVFAEQGWVAYRQSSNRGFVWMPDSEANPEQGSPTQVEGVTDPAAAGMPWYDWDLLPAATPGGKGGDALC